MKRYLLDTCALIYAIGHDEKAKKVQDLIDTYDVYASVINFWEMAIKALKGKLILTVPLKELIDRSQSALSGVLDVTPLDIVHLQNLTAQTEHRDPFDLMLLSQARRGGFSLLTADGVLLSEFKKSTTKI